MPRSTVYNQITSEESIAKILPDNKRLYEDFLDYLKSIDRSPNTIDQYRHDLQIFFVWNIDNNNNKPFIEITKREFARFQNYALTEWKWSSQRIRRVKSTLSSISNYIENILDEEPDYENYRSVVKKIENPVKANIREKTIFEHEEIIKLLDWLVDNKKYKQAAVVACAAFSGRRKAEIPRLKTAYFTDENVIFGALYKTPEKVITKGRGSGGKKLTIYVLKKQFDPYLKLWLKERENNNIDSEWLFPATDNNAEQLSTATMDSWKNSFTKFLGKDFYWHSLRHFFTTELLKANIPESIVQDIQGWDSADMVKIYSDISTEESLGQYFDENGIKKIEKGKLSGV